MDNIRNKSVLVIDDDPGMLRALEKVLTREGCVVSRASWVKEGMEQLMEHGKTFDLILTDLRMPMASGLTILEAVKIGYPSVPVIVMTAFGGAEMKEDCLARGAAGYVEKPLNMAQLLEAVKSALSLAEKHG